MIDSDSTDASAGSREGSLPSVGLVYELDDEQAIDLLTRNATVVRASGDSEGALLELLPNVDAVIMRSPARITRQLIEASPGLRIIAGLGAGTDTVDSIAATDHGIPVINASGVNPETIGEYVIGGLALGRRRLLQASRVFTTDAEFPWDRRTDWRGPQVHGCTFGVVGYGHIGKAACRMARAAFGVELLAFDPAVAIDDQTVEQVSTVDELADRCDVISVHAPLLPSTRGLIGAAQLAALGPEGLLINISRGGIVDQTAMIEALEGGTLGGAVIDVYDPEPPSREIVERLLACSNVFLTPHLGGQTFEAHGARERHVVQQVVGALQGRRPVSLANPTVAFP